MIDTYWQTTQKYIGKRTIDKKNIVLRDRKTSDSRYITLMDLFASTCTNRKKNCFFLKRKRGKEESILDAPVNNKKKEREEGGIEGFSFVYSLLQTRTLFCFSINILGKPAEAFSITLTFKN